MKNYSNDDLIALGLNIQKWRRKGGVAVMEKYGSKHFSLLGKKSAAKKKALKNKAKLGY